MANSRLNKKLRCAVVGCGVVARKSHLPILKRMAEVEIVALCDRQLKAAADLAKLFKIEKVYDDFSRMLDQEKLDFICVCSTPQTHFDLSRQAMSRGIHVLTEKPATLHLSEMDELLQKAKEKKLKFCVVHNFLHSPTTRRALEMAASGKIGDILAVDVRIFEKNTGPISRPEHWSNIMPGGRAGDLSVHAVYLINEFLGKIKAVKAASRKHLNYPWVKFDELMVLLEAERGLGYFYISCNAPAFSHVMKITGTEMSLYLDDFFMTMVKHGTARPCRLRDFAWENLSIAAQLTARSIFGLIQGKLGHRWYIDGHRKIINDFVKCIIYDADLPLNAEGSRECLRVLEEAWNQISA